MPTQQKKWRRLVQKVTYWFQQNEDSSQFMLQFPHHFCYGEEQVTYFAFTYPFSYEEAVLQVDDMERRLVNQANVYFHRETLYHSIEGRKMELVTISSTDGLTEEHESTPGEGLFPDGDRCQRFKDKKVVFLTSRVHPGETPGSHALNGLLSLISE